MNIKHTDGMVTFVMRTGKDFAKSQIPLANAVAIKIAGKNEKNFGMHRGEIRMRAGS